MTDMKNKKETIQPLAPIFNDQLNDDQKWIEEHILKGGDILFYGNLSDEFPSIPREIFWKEFRTISENYLSAGDNRTQIFHKKVDEIINSLIERDKRYGYPSPFCHKGCSQCCNEVIYCTSEEADLIHYYCHQKNITIDYNKLLRQLKYIESDQNLNHTGVTYWNDQKEEDQSCIFLNSSDKTCAIWEVRPFVCRVHLAEETNQYCKPHNGKINPNARGINYPEWSYILTVIFTIHRLTIRQTMGRLLLAEKNNRNK